MRAARAAAVATLATALLTGALLALLTWAAAIGPDELVRATPPGHAPGKGASTPPTPTATLSDGVRPDPLQEALDRPTDVSWLGRVIAVVALLLLAYLVYRLARFAWRRWQDWRARVAALRDPDQVAFEPLTAPEMADAVTDDAGTQQQLLAGGSPRNGIVRCWDRFEQVAAGIGVARRPWETPAEFTLRFFDLLEADARPVQRLASLYREARFSDHDLSEDDRATARAALDAIHRSLHRSEQVR